MNMKSMKILISQLLEDFFFFKLWSRALNWLPACNARAMVLTLSIAHFWKDWKTPKYFFADIKEILFWIDCRRASLSVRITDKNDDRRPSWGWKDMGELIFHLEDEPPQTKMHPNRWEHMPESHLSLGQLFFVHYLSHSNYFSRGHPSDCTKME